MFIPAVSGPVDGGDGSAGVGPKSSGALGSDWFGRHRLRIWLANLRICGPMKGLPSMTSAIRRWSARQPLCRLPIRGMMRRRPGSRLRRKRAREQCRADDDDVPHGLLRFAPGGASSCWSARNGEGSRAYVVVICVAQSERKLVLERNVTPSSSRRTRARASMQRAKQPASACCASYIGVLSPPKRGARRRAHGRRLLLTSRSCLNSITPDRQA